MSRQNPNLCASDAVLQRFGNLPRPWCKLLYFEGNAECATMVAGGRKLPVALRTPKTPLEFARQNLLFNRNLPPRSLTVIVGAAAVDSLRGRPTRLLQAIAMADVYPVLDVRVTHPEVKLPSVSFELFTEPPTLEKPAACVQRSRTDLSWRTGEAMELYQSMVDRVLPHTFTHLESLAYLSDTVVSSMFCPPGIYFSLN